MKLIKRMMSLALALLLAAGMGIPALAAGELTKQETVYTVLSPDGSTASQSVSVHLHREEGLSGVTDESSLTQIECTNGEGGFTQNGQTLTWSVAEPDAYYQGSSDRQAPVSAKITYSLDGQTAPLEELLGKSGRLKISVELTNHETFLAQIDGQEREICTPFVTLVAVVMGDGCRNLQAEHGKVESLNGSQAVGFMCLPGVKASLDGLLPEELGSLEEHLFDSITVEADVEELSAPSIMIACATDPELLEDSALDELQKLDGLQADMDAMDNAMAQLLDGAAELAKGAAQLKTGAGRLQEGAGQLDSGASQLQEGTSALQEGASALNSGSITARDGANELKSGADQLAAGLNQLQNGASTLAGACQQLKAGSSELTAGLETLTGKSQEINAGAQQSAEGSAALSEALAQLATGSQSYADALEGAVSQGAAAVQQLPSPESYSQLLQAAGLDPEQQAALLTAYTGAYQTAGSLSTGLEQLSGQYASINGGIQQASPGAASLAEGIASLTQGLAQYTQGVANAAAGAGQLDNGLAQLSQQVPGLTGGVSELAAGAGSLSEGAGALRDGNAALADGASQLANGIGQLATGAGQLSEGVKALVNGAAELADGTARLSQGAGELQDGLERFDQEAISKLTDSVDPDQLTALNDTIEQMKGQLQAYGSFSGAPKDAKTSTKFIMKTTQPQAPTETENTDQPEESVEDISFWDRLLGLFGK